MKIWAKTKEFSEGKYLVVRRDGSIPPWRHFVMGARDPASAAGLLAYANEAERLGYDTDYVASIREAAGEFAEIAANSKPEGNPPDGPPHRTDRSLVLRMMRHEISLAEAFDKCEAAMDAQMKLPIRERPTQAEQKAILMMGDALKLLRGETEFQSAGVDRSAGTAARPATDQVVEGMDESRDPRPLLRGEGE